MNTATVHEKERCLDLIRSPDYDAVFLAHFRQRADELVEELIETGNEGSRFKLQMLREVFDFEEELYQDWKHEKESAK
jgi:hypothetical protein